ncbi:hypothetical protein [Ectobacillus funiculus]|uniref:DUF2628 domain-containing protein n=1 Tax=Ectobacillus funiculus TaxID=137993 RepID=A0ABV5W9R1_9BACI
MENKRLKYEIPRNVKARGFFLKLDVKGWIGFLSISSFIGISSFLIFGASLWAFVITGFTALSTYFSFEIDEKTGYTNFQTAGMAFNKAMLSKNLTPVWGGNDDEKEKKPVLVDVKTKNQ